MLSEFGNEYIQIVLQKIFDALLKVHGIGPSLPMQSKKRDEAMIVGTRAMLRRRRRCLVINTQWVHCVYNIIIYNVYTIIYDITINTQWVHCCGYYPHTMNVPTICTTTYPYSVPKTTSPVINTRTMCQRNPCVTSHRGTKHQAKYKYKHSTQFDSFQRL